MKARGIVRAAIYVEAREKNFYSKRDCARGEARRNTQYFCFFFKSSRAVKARRVVGFVVGFVVVGD